MTGTMTSLASLTICLAMTTTSAFVLRAPKVNPPDLAWGKQASTSPVGGPLEGDGGKMGAGGTVSRGGGNADKETKETLLPRVPSAKNYVGLRSWSTSPLHAFNRIQPEIIEDGDDTIPIVGGVGGEGGGDSGVTSATQHETAMPHRTTVPAEELSPQEHFFGEEMSVPGIASEAHQSASATPKEDDDNTHGASVDGNATTGATLAIDVDITTSVDIATDGDVATDAGLERLNQEQLSQEASSDRILDEALDTTTSDCTALETELPVAFIADGVASDATFILEGAVDDIMGPVPHDGDGSAVDEGLSSGVPDNGLIDMAGEDIPNDAVDDVMGSAMSDTKDSGAIDKELPNEYVADCLNDATSRVTSNRMEDDSTDDIAGSDMSNMVSLKTVMFDGDMDGFVWSMLLDALSRGMLDSKDRILNPRMNRFLWSKLHDAISGPVNSELADSFDDMITSLLHHAFFGPAASKTVFSFANTDDQGLMVVDAYVYTVVQLYEKFKYARYRRTADRAANAGATAGETKTSGGAVDDGVGSVPGDIDDGGFYEELRSALDASDLVDETASVRPLDPVVTERAAADEFRSVLYDEICDAEFSKAVGFNYPVNELVMSVVRDVLTRGRASEHLIVDAAMNDSMRSKLNEAITGRAATESENLADALDEVVTCLLHAAFFGPEAAMGVSALAKSAKGSPQVVDNYVRAVAELYGTFKEARGANEDIKANVARKAGKGLGGWVKKFWRRVRRKGR